MIIVVGSINLDLIVNVERLPAPGETVLGSTFTTAPGGKGANQALAARRAGAKVRMVGAIGGDSFAEEALALLDEAEVDLSTVKKTDTTTGTAHILVAADGENVIAVVPAANALVLPNDLGDGLFSNGDHVLLQQEIPVETVSATLGAARAAGAVSVLNTAPFQATTAPLLPRADYVVANETEFDLYADALGIDAGDREIRMRAFVEKTGGVLIVTLGGDGVLAVTPDEAFKVPALQITPVDTVGAGDTFCGYLAAGLDAGLSLADALRRAAAAGSLACLKPGAQPAIPMAADVDEALNSESS
ncbi:MAG: ribokinase [Rhizobiaceae bacterium]|nr:ribokinase [Rhizobiaceae bacterium]